MLAIDIDAAALRVAATNARVNGIDERLQLARGGPESIVGTWPLVLANVLAALEEGIDSFEASFGELGGCPVPPGSTGNVSSEDVVSMLHEMGVETGIDLPRLVEASRAAQDVLGRPLGAHVLRAGPVDWNPARSE